jgi:hypothetical protein
MTHQFLFCLGIRSNKFLPALRIAYVLFQVIINMNLWIVIVDELILFGTVNFKINFFILFLKEI